MEEVFINALATRCQIEESLIDLLPEEVKTLVEDRLLTIIEPPEDEIE